MWLVEALRAEPLTAAAVALSVLVVAYLYRLNWLLSSTPKELVHLTPTRWTKPLLQETHERLRPHSLSTRSYAEQIPPKLGRRYIVTGGSGLVGGYMVLQLLERGEPAESIRIVDYHRPLREDMGAGTAAAAVAFAQADIASAASTDAAFARPWPAAVAHLPLTVFHTAAVIVPSDRSRLVYGFCEAVNVKGTRHVVDAARRAAADILVSTTSASIAIRPVEFWASPWKLPAAAAATIAPGATATSSCCWPPNYTQVLDDSDFFRPQRRHEDFYSNYAASKAAAERIVCGANSPTFRTGSIRPANGIYGNPTDNTVGGPLNMGVYPEWTDHIVQSFVHGINVAIAHLHFEAVLAAAPPGSPPPPQAGRPFTVTDPNAPITYGDLYLLLSTLAATPFRTVPLPPVPMLLLSYAIEWYSLLRAWCGGYGHHRGDTGTGTGRDNGLLGGMKNLLLQLLPPLAGGLSHLKPALFTICTHLTATNEAAGRPVSEGGLGYRGVVTTLEGMVHEVLSWNREHSTSDTGVKAPRKRYQSSVSLAEAMQKARAVLEEATYGHGDTGGHANSCGTHVK